MPRLPRIIACSLFFLTTYAQGVEPPASHAVVSWPQFRGPTARGTILGTTHPPETWSATENIEWKRDIPGRGWSSPVVWGDRVLITTVVNHGDSEEPKKGLYFGGNRPDPPQSMHEWIVLCMALNNGEIKWKRSVREALPETSIHIKNSYASESPATDGERFYVVFGGVGIYCFNLDGDQLWRKKLEPRKTRYGWGTAASPILHGDRLYVLNDNDEDSYILALDKHTGDQIWRVARDEKSNWSTPYIWQNKQRTEIMTAGSGQVRSYDLDGNILWWLSGMSSITIATPYEYEGLLFISSGYVGDKTRPLYAIRPGAAGDISLQGEETSNEFISWSLPQGAPYNPSTIGSAGRIYVLYDRGLMAAYDALDGSVVYGKQRIPQGRAFTSSPWAYGGNIFCLNEDGVTFVIKASDRFEILHTNQLQADDMGMATPAIAGDRLLIRTSERLYCVR